MLQKNKMHTFEYVDKCICIYVDKNVQIWKHFLGKYELINKDYSKL
jgi:hypothetical protein